mgnify:CR=1 FL=1
MKKILYVDMDNVLVDFPSAFPHVPNGIDTLTATVSRIRS